MTLNLMRLEDEVAQWELRTNQLDLLLQKQREGGFTNADKVNLAGLQDAREVLELKKTQLENLLTKLEPKGATAVSDLTPSDVLLTAGGPDAELISEAAEDASYAVDAAVATSMDTADAADAAVEPDAVTMATSDAVDPEVAV